MKFGKVDLQIIELLQKGNMVLPKFNEIARKVGKPAPTVFRKIKMFEGEGVITGYSANVNAAKLGRPLTSFVFIKMMYPRRVGGLEQVKEVTDYLLGLEEIEELYIPTGRWNFIAKVKMGDVQDHQRFIENKIFNLPIDDVQSEVMISTLREKGVIKALVKIEE